MLIVGAHGALGIAAATGGIRRRAGWAQANPDDYVLIDDTPVPGYVVPPATIGPAARVSFRPLPPEGKGLIMANGELLGRVPFRWARRRRRTAWPDSPGLMGERRSNGRRPAADAFDRSWD